MRQITAHDDAAGGKAMIDIRMQRLQSNASDESITANDTRLSR